MAALYGIAAFVVGFVLVYSLKVTFGFGL